MGTGNIFKFLAAKISKNNTQANEKNYISNTYYFEFLNKKH
jgi:hypothetical protein